MTNGDQLRHVARLKIRGIASRLLATKDISLNVTDAAIDMLLSKVSDQVHMYGARPIKRYVEKDVMTKICKMVVRDEVKDNCCITVDADKEMKELVFNINKSVGGSRGRPTPWCSRQSWIVDT